MSDKIYYAITFVVGFVLACLLMKQCNSNPCPDIVLNSHHETAIHDTVWPDTVFTKLFVKVPVHYNVYIPELTFDNGIATNVYKDSVSNDEVVIVYSDSIRGELLGKELSYKLLKPLTVTNTITKSDTFTIVKEKAVSGIYGHAGIGSDLNQKVNVFIGADFISSKKWGCGYSFILPDKTHNVNFKYRIF